MKVWKKLAGVVLALAVMMTLTVFAGATPVTVALTTDTEPYVGSGTAIDGTYFKVTMNNNTNFQAADGQRLSEDVTFTISGDGVTFNTNQQYSNVAPHGTTATVSFDGSSDGTEETSFVDLTFDTTNFTSSSVSTPSNGLGRYYKVTITPTQSGSPGTPYYLYVFVKVEDTDDDGTDEYIPYAAIMATEEAWGSVTRTTKKDTIALVSSVNPGSFKVEKKVTGVGSESEEFNFSVKITFPTGFDPSTFAFPYTSSGVGVTGFVSGASSGNLDGSTITQTDTNVKYYIVLTGKLKHNTWFQIDGLPAGTVVEVKETPNSAVSYVISSAIADMDSTTLVGGDSGNTENGTNYYTKGTVLAGTDGVITYTNYLQYISPTGVVLRFAPYLAMLGAGLTTMVIAPRRKEEE